MIHELLVSVEKPMDVVEVAGLVRIALGVSVIVHSFYCDSSYSVFDVVWISGACNKNNFPL